MKIKARLVGVTQPDNPIYPYLFWDLTIIPNSKDDVDILNKLKFPIDISIEFLEDKE